jgi:hypothetical protein
MTLLLFSLFVPIFTGWALVRLLLVRRHKLEIHLLLQLSLAVGIGLGVSSCLSFLWLLLFGPLNKNTLIFESIVCISTVSFSAIQGRRNWGKTPSSFSPSTTKAHWLIVLTFYTLLIFILTVFFLLFLINPHGRWDAWYIWNAKARFLFRGAEYWNNAFSSLLAKPDYPPLIPINVARIWYYIKKETQLIPMLISLLFTFSTIGMITSSLFTVRTRYQGYLAAIVLMGTPFFIVLGADQIADVPISFYFLTTIVLFYLYDQKPDAGYGLLIMAGLTAGLAGWTKNEGLLFIMSIPIARGAIPKQSWKTYSKTMLFFVLGLLPILFFILVFKIRLAPTSDLLGSQGKMDLLIKFTDFHRYFQIIKAFGITFFNFGLWPKISLIPLLILYAYLLGIKVRSNWGKIVAPLISLGILSFGFFLVFFFTSYDLAWYMRTTLDRLYLQLWPSLLFIYFILVNPPDQSLMRRDPLNDLRR